MEASNVNLLDVSVGNIPRTENVILCSFDLYNGPMGDDFFDIFYKTDINGEEKKLHIGVVDGENGIANITYGIRKCVSKGSLYSIKEELFDRFNSRIDPMYCRLVFGGDNKCIGMKHIISNDKSFMFKDILLYQ